MAFIKEVVVFIYYPQRFTTKYNMRERIYTCFEIQGKIPVWLKSNSPDPF